MNHCRKGILSLIKISKSNDKEEACNHNVTKTSAWNELKVNEPWTRLRHLRVIVVLDIRGLLLRLLMELLVLMSIERSTGHNTVGLLGGLGTLYWAWALREGPLGQEGCQVRPLADYNTSSTLVDRRARPRLTGPDCTLSHNVRFWHIRHPRYRPRPASKECLIILHWGRLREDFLHPKPLGVKKTENRFSTRNENFC